MIFFTVINFWCIMFIVRGVGMQVNAQTVLAWKERTVIIFFIFAFNVLANIY